MSIVNKIVLRIVFIICVVLILITDYSGLIAKLMGGNKTEETTRTPKPKNPGYGDPNSELVIDAEFEDDTILHIGSSYTKNEILKTIKNACLPKLICELNARSEKQTLTESEKSLLSLIRDTSISTTMDSTTKYHFAAHMGQLIAGVEGNGCHNFYPTCPFPGLQVLKMMKRVRMR